MAQQQSPERLVQAILNSKEAKSLFEQVICNTVTTKVGEVLKSVNEFYGICHKLEGLLLLHTLTSIGIFSV